MDCGNSSLFGNQSQFIKPYSGDIIAVQGSNTVERLFLSDLRIPYKQILRGRVILKAGQANFLLNFLGLGDNATFLAIRATYNPKAYDETSNYVQWSYFDSLNQVNYMNQLLVLTGNSTNRIKQLYLTNPNSGYSVQLDIMTAIVDDQTSVFTDTVNQIGNMFTGLTYSNIVTYVKNESIYVSDVTGSALIYLTLNTINEISLSGTSSLSMLTIDDTSIGNVYLQFNSLYDAKQALSGITYALQNSDVILGPPYPPGLEPDLVPPTIFFLSNVGTTGSTISMTGSITGPPYDTSMGTTFSTTIPLSWGINSTLTKGELVDLLVSNVSDNRDGTLHLGDSNLILKDNSSRILESITSVGTYSLTFNLSDLAGNSVDSLTNMNLYII